MKALKALVESKAIYYFAFAAGFVAFFTWIELMAFQECRDFGFSLMYCLLK